MKLIAQGAEAKLYLDTEKGIVKKQRTSKGYRHPQLDEQIRTRRTKSKAKLLEKSSKIVSSPFSKISDKFEIEIDYIDGDKLSEKLNSYPEKTQFEIMKTLGEEVSKLHKNNIIHGDLTTSNTILKDEKVYIIDFGLGYISSRLEDKAVDLHLIKQALEAKHFQNDKLLFKAFLRGYNSEKEQSKLVLEQLKKVEARGRYKH